MNEQMLHCMILIVSGEGQDLLSGTGQTYLMHLKLVYANFIRLIKTTPSSPLTLKKATTVFRWQRRLPW